MLGISESDSWRLMTGLEGILQFFFNTGKSRERKAGIRTKNAIIWHLFTNLTRC